MKGFEDNLAVSRALQVRLVAGILHARRRQSVGYQWNALF